MSIRDEEAEAAEALEATGNYRVLRRIPKWVDTEPPEGTRGIKIGLMVDVETTGLDHRNDQIIQLGAALFSYGPDGQVYTVSDPLNCYNDPGRPIPPEITELTGITDDMVRGQSIDLKEFDDMVNHANFCIAFHSAFDRKFVERISMAAVKKPWGCAMEQIPWKEEGIAGRRLEYIAHAMGYFYEAHRAADDCLAAIHLLSLPLPKSGKIAINALREVAARPSHRVRIEGRTFDFNHLLKARGYRFDGDREPKTWYRDLDTAEAIEPEKAWIAAEIKCKPTITEETVTMYDRFSVRG